MKKICLVVLYFGELPNYFKIWLETCKFNKDVNFLLVTDDRHEYDYPNNVKVLYQSFDSIKVRFQNLFKFNITLDSPYKLCDYKPAYGEAFKEYLEEYDFWGHCDIDLIFGDIRKFITNDILNYYDRVLTRGHFSLYKNNNNINSKYRTVIVEGCQKYTDVFTTNKSCCYDEWGAHCGNGISEIFNKIGIKQYDELIYADLVFLNYKFKLAQNINDNINSRIFIFNRGKLYDYSIKDNKIVSKEYMYCHFQKRNPKVNLDGKLDSFYLLPPGQFEVYNQEKITIDRIKILLKKKRIYMAPFTFRKKQMLNFIKAIFS